MFNLEWTKRTHKGLRRWVLYLVRDTPKTGAEIMDSMEGFLQGWWRPSPGSVYPLLASLTKEGVLSMSEDKRYSLTDQGRAELELPFPWFGPPSPQARSIERILDEMSSNVSYLEDLAQSGDEKLLENSAKVKDIGRRLTSLGASS